MNIINWFKHKKKFYRFFAYGIVETEHYYWNFRLSRSKTKSRYVKGQYLQRQWFFVCPRCDTYMPDIKRREWRVCPQCNLGFYRKGNYLDIGEVKDKYKENVSE